MRVELTIPSSTNEISLGAYQKFAKVEGDADFTARKMLQIFCGVDDVFKVPVSDINAIAAIITEALSEKPEELIKHFSLNGKRLGFVPNLSKLTYGEFIDLERYISDWDNMHKAMSILYRQVVNEKGGMYDIVEYNGTENAEEYKDMPISVVFSAIVFFYRIGNKISSHYLSNLEEEMNRENILQGDNSQVSGAGMLRLMSYLREMSPSTIPSLNSPRRIASLLSPTKVKSQELK